MPAAPSLHLLQSHRATYSQARAHSRSSLRVGCGVVEAAEMTAKPDAAAYDRARQQFAYFEPQLNNPIFMENAGGSQVGICVC